MAGRLRVQVNTGPTQTVSQRKKWQYHSKVQEELKIKRGRRGQHDERHGFVLQAVVVRMGNQVTLQA